MTTAEDWEEVAGPVLDEARDAVRRGESPYQIVADLDVVAARDSTGEPAIYFTVRLAPGQEQAGFDALRAIERDLDERVSRSIGGVLTYVEFTAEDDPPATEA